MTIEHVAIWTNQLDVLKDYYQKFIGGIPNSKYRNESTGFESFFLTFDSGARLELMSKPNVPVNKNDTINRQHLGIIHLAFGVATMQEVDAKARELQQAGYQILRGPRKTGDGYYEFETLDPDNNRLEVTTLFVSEN
ncbi:VOC family protein [Adhaeribacter radiodurans]|uniref:VOC family protein n=1 Tax=Adhaeribacter radiodurans TaxID=2745197 RepID=A0A7L7LB06_9BACT|nr:VOC family protein [Adhaeribacter radiodurans]QMU30016.1 VOC family protein [Adhaeribacter radiodurans]